MNETLLVPMVEDGRLVVDGEAGIVYRRRRSGELKPIKSRAGEYVNVRASVDGRIVVAKAHRLIWTVLVGPIERGLQINHLDGRKDRNCLENLEVVSPAENSRHALLVLGEYRGAANGNARLSEEDVLDIRARFSEGEKREAIAKDHGVTCECVRLIGLRLRWSSLADAESEAAA